MENDAERKEILLPGTSNKGPYVQLESVVKIIGTVKEKVAKIVVNEYTLQKFRPGDRNWQYIANKNFGDLKEGLNEFKVVALDAAGNTSEPATFKVTYRAPASSTTSGSVNP